MSDESSIGRVTWPAELVAEICDLANGPARSVLEEAAREWLEAHKQAVHEGRSRLMPYPADQSDPCSPEPKLPLPMPSFGGGCAVLAAVHDQNCHRCVTLWPKPPVDDAVGYAVWETLRDEVRKKPDPSYVRKILGDVRREVQKRGVKPVRPKRSTVPGEARAKIVAALTAWHKYSNGGCGNLTPVGVNELARLAVVAGGSVTPFFNTQFTEGKRGGHKAYQRVCNDPATLVLTLQTINGELTPGILARARALHENEGDTPDDPD